MKWFGVEIILISMLIFNIDFDDINEVIDEMN